MPKSDSKREFSLNNDISLKGLENYIKERVLGHDKIIRYIAKTIIMNYTATDTDEVEPILLVGPTGTGKTQTMQVAASYLNIPFAAVNMVNLVPQGIKGTSLEDCLYSLLVSANYKKEIAERGIFFGDEMDKLGKANVDYKEPIKDIFLNFFDGVPFLLDKKEDDYFFNTKFLNKVFAGRFEDVFEIPQKTIGFDADTKIEKDDFGEMIYDKEYYGKELITRITHIYLYKELNNETRKRILLESKLSRYLNKKIRYERQFGVTLEAQDSYIEAVLEKLDKSKLSMRQLNNLISHTLDEVEYVLLSGNNKGKKLILTKDIVEDNSKFTLI